jgi:hypothetical protein
MSVSGISSSSFFQYDPQNVQNRQQFQQEFQQLGQDLQSGNLTAAQTDFATLQQSGPLSNSASSQSSNPISQEFSQLATDLQAGNLTAAQSDFSTIQQNLQSQATQQHSGHHRHHGGGGSSAISQALNQLGQALQSGSLTSAQQAYTTLQQDFQQFSQNLGTQAQTQPVSTSISVSA